MISEKKAFISSNSRIVYLVCPPPCGPFSVQESAVGGLSYKVKQAELAEAVGCSAQVISNIERGYSGCSSVLAARIAEVLGVPADDLIKEKESNSFYLTKDEKELISQYRRLRPNEQKLIRCTLESFINN